MKDPLLISTTMRDSIVRGAQQTLQLLAHGEKPAMEDAARGCLMGTVNALTGLKPAEFTDQDQENAAKELFAWWWNVGNRGEGLISHWYDCTQEIQAFWMDGAWRAYHA